MTQRTLIVFAVLLAVVPRLPAQHGYDPYGPPHTSGRSGRGPSALVHASQALGLCTPIYACDLRFRCRTPLRCQTTHDCHGGEMAAAPAEIPFMPPAPQEHESPKTASAPKLSDEEQALLTALRRDRDEEVRRLAAVELGKWASRSPEATRALKITASGSSADGFPAERSAQVKEAAAIALNGQPPAPAETKRPMASAARPPAVFPTGSETARPTLAPTPQRPTRAEPPLLTTPLPTRSTVNPFRAID